MSTATIIDKLKEIRDSNLVDVFVPSLGTNIKFKQLSVKQQKDLIKTGLEGALSGIYLDNVINSIITDNSTFAHKFLVTDKISIIIALRAASFGTQYSVDDETVDISPILGRKLVYDLQEAKELTFSDKIKVNITVPTLEKDTLTNNVQINELTSNKDLKVSDAIGSLYVYEVVKFISGIEISGTVVNFGEISPKDAVRVVESLPATLNSEIIKYIQEYRTKESEFLTIGEKTVLIDARFFALDS
jgi:hypothetical protein